jgi:hypothetical protein
VSLIWAVPVVAAMAGFGLLVIGLRALGAAADDLRMQLERLGEVRLAVADLRDQSAATRAGLQRARRR